MTLSTAMYWCGFDPYTGRKVHVARDLAEKRRQKDYFFWYKPKSLGKKKAGTRGSGHSQPLK
jgi:hypothetical protein